MDDLLSITKALGDRNRLRALMALADRELCVCQIIELLDLAPSTVSKHMHILRQARLVEATKRGRWVHYRLAGPGADKAVKDALKWTQRNLEKDADILADARTLNRIVKMDPEKLCRKQTRN